MNYQKLYSLLFNKITDAIELIDKLDILGARNVLIDAQQQAEEIFISQDDVQHS